MEALFLLLCILSELDRFLENYQEQFGIDTKKWNPNKGYTRLRRRYGVKKARLQQKCTKESVAYTRMGIISFLSDVEKINADIRNFMVNALKPTPSEEKQKSPIPASWKTILDTNSRCEVART